MGISLPDSEKKDSDAPFVTLQKTIEWGIAKLTEFLNKEDIRAK